MSAESAAARPTTVAAPLGPISDVFARYAELSRQEVAKRLPRGEPSPPLYDVLPRYVLRPGKAIRPVLCLAACVACGGGVSDALPVAVALELLHNAFLVHDDIQDGSATRRGGPSLQAEHGVAVALNAGDALAALAMDEVATAAERLGPRLGSAVMSQFAALVRETIEGQAIELGWERDGVVDVTVRDYLVMVLKKTSWYTAIEPVRLGALIGSRGRVGADFGIRFGYHLGAMFQMANDLAGVFDDLVEGKRSLMMIHLLRHARPAERDRVTAFLRRARADRSVEEAAWLLDRMGQVGSMEYGRRWARAMGETAAHEARAEFDRLPESEERRLLLDIVPALVQANAGYLGRPEVTGLSSR